MINVLSMGGGVNTTALLIKDIDIYDKVVFADTGDEHPRTYQYIEDYLKPYAGNKWVTVRNDKYDSLYDFCKKTNQVPIRRWRWCTKDFKIRPIRKYYRSVLKATKQNPVIQYIGIALDESHRANFSHLEPKYIKSEYPLLDYKMTRRDCLMYIQKHGWPEPAKSGCYYCPFATNRYFKLLPKDLLDKAIALEENVKRFPEVTIKDKPLRILTAQDSNTLDDYIDEATCDSGHCMV